MIPWWWLLPAVSFGACVGLVVYAVLRAASDADDRIETLRADRSQPYD